MPELSATTDRLALLLWATDPSRPERCATPFAIAAAAAAMDAEVEIYFSASSVKLLHEDTARGLYAAREGGRDIAWFMREARSAGVRFLGCHASLGAYGLDAAACGDWLDGVSGSTAFAARAMDPNWRTLVF